LPLATSALSLRRLVRILFFRPDLSGAAIASGDIRLIKPIFDALHLPHSKAELKENTAQTAKIQFY
jgi:hypothetical protein